ncbi:MAG: zonular occludens toxin domain-containing protein [Magnetococcus sp. XQGC-1]
MIYLITGAPGTGKTARALTILKGLPQYPDKTIVVGVKDYKGKGQYFETIPTDGTSEPFPFEAYPGFCFLIDEAQDYWPSRVAGRQAPESLTFLPKHRHIGQDYIITCQFPTQLDVKLRHLVGRHIHLQKEALGVFEYEAGHCVESVQDFPPHSKRPRAALDKETFTLYNSMEGEETVLQKQKPRMPLKLWLILGVVGAMLALASYFLFFGDNLLTRTVKGEGAGPVQVESGDMLGGMPGAMGQATGKPGQQADILPLREIKHPAQLNPGNTDYPELAKQPRIPVSCIANARRCICFDQAVQLIEGMSEKRCRALIGGRDALVAAWARDDTPRREVYPAPPPPPPPEPSTPLTADKTEPKPVDNAGPAPVRGGAAPPRLD